MRRLLRKIFFWIVFIFPSIAFSQRHQIDSLKNVLKTQKPDTNKVNGLNLLSTQLKDAGVYDSALIYANQAALLAEQFGFQKGEADAFRNSGLSYFYQGNYTMALQFHKKALAINKAIGNKKNSARNLDNIGRVYSDLGDLPKAIEYQLKALSICKQIGDQQGVARALGNLGNSYYFEHNYAKTLECYMEGMEIDKKIGWTEGVATCFGNIGNLYCDQQNFSKALEYNLQALALHRKLENVDGVSNDLCNIGNIYNDQKNYTKALQYYFEAKKTIQKTGDMARIENIMNNIGNTYFVQKKYKEAQLYLDSALYLSKITSTKDNLKFIYGQISAMDSTNGNYKAALSDYKNYILYRDSLVNDANTKKIVQAQMNFDFQQKEAAQQAVQDQKNAVEKQDRNKQRIIRNAFIGGFLLMILLAFFIFRGLREKQKANTIISQQKNAVEEQKQKVDVAFAQLHQKHKEITDSINYAKRIQLAMLKEENHVSENLPEHFIFFQPKDVVSGDFYWSFEKENFWYVAAVDCTGHGVPGAFLTMLGSAFLNDICAQKNIFSPAEILNLLRDKIIHELSSQSEIKDGMDISLCCLNLKTKEMQWAGANNPLWFIQQNELQEIKPDKQPIGFQQNQKTFTNHTLQLHKGDVFYLFTDGFADQFGGEKGKKFKYKQLKETLQIISAQSMNNQKQNLQNAFQNWKGNLEQIDDVCVIGIRV